MECPSELGVFTTCMKANNNDESKCYDKKQGLLACAGLAFRKINSKDSKVTFWSNAKNNDF